MAPFCANARSTRRTRSRFPRPTRATLDQTPSPFAARAMRQRSSGYVPAGTNDASCASIRRVCADCGTPGVRSARGRTHRSARRAVNIACARARSRSRSAAPRVCAARPARGAHRLLGGRRSKTLRRQRDASCLRGRDVVLHSQHTFGRGSNIMRLNNIAWDIDREAHTVDMTAIPRYNGAL